MSSALLLAAITALTLGEIGAVVSITIWGPHDQTSTSIEVLIGMVGPIVASLVAVVHGSNAQAQAAQAQTQAAQAQAHADQAHQRVDQAAQSGVPPIPPAVRT